MSLKKIGNCFSKNLVSFIYLFIVLIILLNIVLNFCIVNNNLNKIQIDFNFIISILNLIVVLYLYDRFGIKGFNKQKELEKTKELYSILTKSKFYELSYNETKKIDKCKLLCDIKFNNENQMVIKKELLEKFHSDLNKICINPFFPYKLFKKISIDKFHFSQFKVYDNQNIEKIIIVCDNNSFPEKDFSNDKQTTKKNDYRIIDKSFFETYNDIIKTTKKYL